MSDFEPLDGLYPAAVTTNADPLNMGRVKVVFPWMDNAVESNWARVVQPYAGRQRGMFFIPEVGDEVVVMFEHGDFNHPLVVGDTWNGLDAPPEPNDPAGENHDKVIETRSGHSLVFNDTPGQEYIQFRDCSLNNIIRWDSKDNTLTVNARTGDIVLRSSRTMNLDSRELFFKVTDSAKMSVGADHSVTVKQSTAEVATNSKTWKASTSLTVRATKIDLKAGGTFGFDGSSVNMNVAGNDSDQTVVEGTTTDTVNTLKVTADEVYERAEKRTWNIAESEVEAQAIVFDTSGSLKNSANQITATAQGGDFSVRGSSITTEGGSVKIAGGFNGQPKMSAPPRQGEGQGGKGPKPEWVEFVVTDASGMPLPYVECEVTLPDGRVETETTDEDGMVRFGNIPPGSSKIRVKDRFPG